MMPLHSALLSGDAACGALKKRFCAHCAAILQTVAAILHIGNVAFKSGPEEAADLSGQAVRLLRVSSPLPRSSLPRSPSGPYASCTRARFPHVWLTRMPCPLRAAPQAEDAAEAAAALLGVNRDQLVKALTTRTIKTREGDIVKARCSGCSSHSHTCRTGSCITGKLIAALTNTLLRFISRRRWTWRRRSRAATRSPRCSTRASSTGS